MSHISSTKNTQAVIAQKNNPARIKVSLLSEGIAFDIDLFRNFKGSFYENQYVYGRTSTGVMPPHRLPQILKLGNGVVTALLRRENTHWQLRLRDNIPQLYYGGEYIQDVELPERPPYFGKLLKRHMGCAHSFSFQSLNFESVRAAFIFSGLQMRIRSDGPRWPELRPD